MSSYHTIADFIADVKAVLAAGDVSDDLLERLAAVMRDLVRSSIVVQVHDELTGTIHHGRQSGPLYTDESGLTLVRGRREPTAFTPIHNHMRALLIIVVAEVRRLHAGVTHRGEDVHVQAFIPHGAIEALLFAILPWAAWVNIQGSDIPLHKPDLNRDSHKLWSIIVAQIGQRTVLRHR